MHELKLLKGFKKSAKIVGDTMGNYHPHGDSAIYQTMVNMVWDRYPLIEGHGNFGSPTDNAASMRYTEAKLSPLSAALFEDVSVAEMVPNYSDDRKEPLVLTSRLPLLLLNGSTGIGVGLRATIPPHNLRELVRCLIYFVKKDHPRLTTVVKNMPGPDYGHGVMLSSPEDVRDLYATGKGTLRFRCEYHFEDSVLVVTSLSPGFNMSAFLTKMRKLSEENLIEFCSDASSADGVRIYVGFKDGAVVRDRVLPELHTSQSYQFHVVKRESDTGLSDATLFSGGLFRMFDEFISFRRLVEDARLRRELSIAKASLLKSKAVLVAIKKIDVVYSVLKERHTSLESMTQALAARLSLSERQAAWILDMKVHRLARMNEDTQRGKIDQIKEVVGRIRADLKDIDGVISTHLKELLQFSDPRGTKLAAEAVAPELDVESTLTWVMSQGSKIIRLPAEPSRRNKFDHVVSGSSSITAVYANNNAEVLSVSYLTEHSGVKPVVGLISGDAQMIVALDDVGKVVVLKNPPGKKTEFNAMRDATKLIAAVGVHPDGYLGMATAGGKGRVVHASDLKGTRAFVKGFKLYPTAEHGSRRLVVTQLFSLPPGAELYTVKGRCLSCKDEEYFDTRGPVMAVGPRNFVSVKTGKRYILDAAETVKALRRGELTKCWILD
jgi:DNA gyrase/topoisomerase IV subunit A